MGLQTGKRGVAGWRRHGKRCSPDGDRGVSGHVSMQPWCEAALFRAHDISDAMQRNPGGHLSAQQAAVRGPGPGHWVVDQAIAAGVEVYVAEYAHEMLGVVHRLRLRRLSPHAAAVEMACEAGQRTRQACPTVCSIAHGQQEMQVVGHEASGQGVGPCSAESSHEPPGAFWSGQGLHARKGAGYQVEGHGAAGRVRRTVRRAPAHPSAPRRSQLRTAESLEMNRPGAPDGEACSCAPIGTVRESVAVGAARFELATSGTQSRSVA
jgi:hypothetical protein